MDDMSRFRPMDDMGHEDGVDDPYGDDMGNESVVGNMAATLQGGALNALLQGPSDASASAAALHAIGRRANGDGVAAPAPPRFGRRVAAALRTIDAGRLHGRPWWAHERHEW